MSLFGAVNIASNALNTAQVGLQVTGNNIANANTPGYAREVVVLKPAPTYEKGGLLLGLGVKVEAIKQVVDPFLESQMRGAISESGNMEAQEDAYKSLMMLIGELSETDISSSMDAFFNSIADITNNPESIATRNLSVLEGQSLTSRISSLSRDVWDLSKDLNQKVIDSADDVNRLLADVADLNKKIVSAEGGGAKPSDAVGLRDQRSNALKELSELIGITTLEQPNGSMNVYSGGDYIVYEGTYRSVASSTDASDGGYSTLVISGINKAIDTSSGSVGGMIVARDENLKAFSDGLDDFARSLIYEFNKTYSSGQGLSGFSEIVSETAVLNPQLPLDAAVSADGVMSPNLSFTPVNGSFQFLVKNLETGLTETTMIPVRLNGYGNDSTLDDLAAQIDAIDGVSAEVTARMQLSITSDAEDIQFAFADDTSGVLAALGINTFFTGTDASSIGVSDIVSEDASKFASSRQGVGNDTENAVLLAQLLDEPIEANNNISLLAQYSQLMNETNQSAAITTAEADGSRYYRQTLEGQRMAISGVNLDEEVIKMMNYQRLFQFSAQFISTVNGLLDNLLQI